MTAADGASARFELPLAPPAEDLSTGSVRTLAKAAAGSFGLNIANLILTTVLTIVLARTMGVTDYGIYAFVAGSLLLLCVPAVLGADRLLVRDVAVYVREGAFGLARGLITRATQVTLLMALAIAAVTALFAWLAGGGTSSPALIAFLAGVAALPALALGRVAEAGLAGLHHVVLGQVPEYLVRPALLLGLVTLGAVVGSALPAPLAVALYALSAWIAALFALYLLRTRRPSQMRQEAPAYRTGAWLTGGLALTLLSSTAIINSQIGVVLLGALSTPDAAGLFSVAQRGALLVAFPLAALNVALAPTAARLWSAGDRVHLQRLVTLGARWVLVGSLPVVLVFCLFGRPILELLFGSGFGAADTALAIVSLGQLVNVATGSVTVLLVMSSHQRQAMLATALGAVINVVVAALLIPAFHEVGAAFAAAFSLTISNGLMLWIARRSLGIDATALGWAPRP
jgi:O-antigen/teichoic acid export membrane protein